jgi:putative two-component system response regulator
MTKEQGAMTMRSDVETEPARLETPAGQHPGSGDTHIVVVDDEPANARLVARMLASADYDRVDTFTRPRAALDALNGHRPDLLVLDLQMPDMDGVDLMQRVRESTDGPLPVPVLILTSDGSREAKEKALRAGAQDFLVKPLSPLEVRLRVKNLLETRRLERALADRNERLDALVEERTAELEDARLETLEKLALAAEYRDDETGEHIRRVGRMSARLGRALGLDEDRIGVLREAAPLHDVGKIGIDDSILRKPGSLTEEEFDVMKTHTTIGAEILSGSRSRVLRGAETIARSHHENWDGSGYPDGLAGAEIPLEARIVAVADVFDSLTHERVYKGAIPVSEAEEKIRELDGTKFDPQVVRAFAIVRDASSQ